MDELELAEARRIQRIAKGVGFFEADVSDAHIEAALLQAIQSSAAAEADEPVVTEKQRRKTRVFQQNRARVERAKRTIQRLKKEERRRDASQKWQLGNLLDMAGLRSIEIDVLDEKLTAITHNLEQPAVRQQWQARGSEWLKKQKDGLAKNGAGYSASFELAPDKADAHRKITLGGLVKKHQLESLSPALLLGALLEIER